ncbi:MAG: hypothetical protein ABIQ57_11295 [Candidatus Kapaibacterium sp.]
MNNNRKRFTAMLAMCLGFFFLSLGSMQAKLIWQIATGADRNDAARGGIVQTSDGGYITVGESQSFSRGGDYDVYVVKIDPCGFLQWSSTYNIGGNDYGRKIRQTPDGGYIITGETDNKYSCCTNSDAFLLKIKEDGEVDWTKTYGGYLKDESSDVELYNGGRGYIMAGSTSSCGAGSTDAWLVLTDDAGNVVWGKAYGGYDVDKFNSVVQADNGDLIAAGFTNSYNVTDPVFSTSDVYIVRVNVSGNVIWANHYGGSSNDVANCVIEAKGGEIVVAGYTTSLGTKYEAYLLRVKSSGSFIADVVHGGGHDVGRDEYRELREIPGTGGEIIAVGRIMKPFSGSLGDYDVFVTRVKASLGRIWSRNYGGRAPDEGYSVTLVADADLSDYNFAFAGVTQSFGAGLEDEYVIKAWSNGETLCNESEPGVYEEKPGFKDYPAPTCEPLFIVQCAAKTAPVYNEKYTRICIPCDAPFDGGNGVLGRNNGPAQGRNMVDLGRSPIGAR